MGLNKTKALEALDRINEVNRTAEYMGCAIINQDDIEAIRTALTSLCGEGWQEIETYDYKNEPNVIVFFEGKVGEAWYDDHAKSFWWANTDNEYGYEFQPTKWQPLPEAPISAAQGDE